MNVLNIRPDGAVYLLKEHYLRDALEAMLAGKKVPVTETKALGCTIKFRPQS